MVAHHNISFYISNQWLISNIFRSIAKSQIRIILKKNYKKLKKARLRRAFVRVPCFKGKEPQGVCALLFALKHAFNNTGLNDDILWQDDFPFSILVKSFFLPPHCVWEFPIKIVTTIGALINEKLLNQKKKTNDLVFVMYNLKIKREKS